VWSTALIVYSVSHIDKAIQSGSGSSLVPTTSPIPVQLTGGVSVGGPVVVPVGNDSVWVVDPTQNSVIVVTRNKDGSIHAETKSYQTP
jgi:hypothetical protein